MQQDGWAFSFEGCETTGSVPRLWSQETQDQDREYLIHVLLCHRQTQIVCGRCVLDARAEYKNVLVYYLHKHVSSGECLFCYA